MNIINFPIKKIKFDKNQPRQTLNQEKIRDMAQSIRTEGVINPVELDKSHVLITGELRVRAAELAGLKEIPSKIFDISDNKRFRRQVIENIHHNTMNDWDTAKALAKLLKQLPMIPGSIGTHGGKPNFGYSELGRMIGKSKDFITDHIDILSADQAIQKAIRQGKIPYTLLRAIAQTPVPYQKAMEKKIIAGEFKTREAALEVSSALNRNPEKAVAILEKNYTNKTAPEIGNLLSKIAPRFTDIIKEKLEVGQEFIQIKKQLLTWLKDNQPESIVQKDRFLIVLGMSELVDKLNAWGKLASQPKLKA